MEALNLEATDDKFLITIDKNTLNTEFVMRLIERLRVEQLAEKINFSTDVEQLGKDIKAEWWNNNKTRLLGSEK